MPDTERITDQENRTFDSSLGDWTGDAVWEIYPYGDYGGIAKFYLGPAKHSGQMILEYPHLNIKLNGTYTLTFVYYNIIPPLQSITTFKVTDGTYTFEDFVLIDDTHPWKPAILYFDTPLDWNKLTTILEITIEAIPPTESTMFCDNFSIMGEDFPPVPAVKIQYLPIMGMG